MNDAELDAAIAAISDPARMRLAEGGWFDTAHQAAVREAVSPEDLDDRARMVRTLCAEETRLSMLVGVAVGIELARELGFDALNPEPHEED